MKQLSMMKIFFFKIPFDRHKTNCEKPLKVNVIDLFPTSEGFETLKTPKQGEELSEVAFSVVDLIPHSYCEQSKRLLYLSR